MGLMLCYIGFILLCVWGYKADKRKKEKREQELAELTRQIHISYIEKLRKDGIFYGPQRDIGSLSSHELDYYYEKGIEAEKKHKEWLESYLRQSRFSHNMPHLSVIRNSITTSNNKPDWLAFKNYLEQRDVNFFYHFTDRSNLYSIKQKGGLFSWKYCEENHINIPKAGGDILGRRLDVRYNLENYVRLSFCIDHPMAYRLKQEGYDLVLLKIKIDVAWLNDTLFSDMNATDIEHRHGPLLEDLMLIDIDATRESFVSRTSPSFRKHQAEVLVKNFVPIEYIENINNPINL